MAKTWCLRAVILQSSSFPHSTSYCFTFFFLPESKSNAQNLHLRASKLSTQDFPATSAVHVRQHTPLLAKSSNVPLYPTPQFVSGSFYNSLQTHNGRWSEFSQPVESCQEKASLRMPNADGPQSPKLLPQCAELSLWANLDRTGNLGEQQLTLGLYLPHDRVWGNN